MKIKSDTLSEQVKTQYLMRTKQTLNTLESGLIKEEFSIFGNILFLLSYCR